MSCSDTSRGGPSSAVATTSPPPPRAAAATSASLKPPVAASSAARLRRDARRGCPASLPLLAAQRVGNGAAWRGGGGRATIAPPRKQPRAPSRDGRADPATDCRLLRREGGGRAVEEGAAAAATDESPHCRRAVGGGAQKQVRAPKGELAGVSIIGKDGGQDRAARNRSVEVCSADSHGHGDR